MRAIIYNIFFFILTATSFAQLGSYSYKRKLEPVTKENYYTIPLVPQVTAHCQNNLSDLRLYSIGEKDTTEIPYLLQWFGDQTEETSIPFKLINDVSHLKCCSYITLKMDSKKVINRINLEVAEANFDKLLSIEGSNDNKEWFTIKEHLRIAGFQNAATNFKSTVLYFPAAEYSYFRIKFDDDGSEKITVGSASAFETSTTKGNYNELPIKSKTQTENKKEKTSELIVELPDAYLLSYLTLKSANKIDFYRDINIYKSNGLYHTPKKEEEIWEQVSSGIISSGDDNTFALNNIKAKRLKIEVINYDNQPVSLDGIKIYSEKVALVAKLPAGSQLVLAYGKENDAAPVYDLVHFKEKIPATLSDVPYGNEEIKTLPAAAILAQPFITDKKWLWIVMVVVIGLIGYFALSMVKKE